MDVRTLNTTINNMCAYLRNFFVVLGQRAEGVFALSGGKIRLPLDLKVGQRVYIEPTDEHTEAMGSYRVAAKSGKPGRDGHLYTLEGLDEVSDKWCGVIHGQRVPAEFIRLCERIVAWEEANVPSNLVSESVSGFYSKTLATNSIGLPVGALEVFRKDLSRFRGRMVTGVRY